MAERAKRSRWRSVRTRTTAGATAVVAVGLGAAGVLVLAALRGNLVESASLQADRTAHDIVAQLDAGTALDRLRLPDPEDEPVQVVSPDGTVLAADEELRGVPAMAGFGPDDSNEADDDDESEESEAADESDDEEPEEDDPPAVAGAAAPVAADTDGSHRSPATAEVVFGEVELVSDDRSGADRFRVAALAGTAPDGRPVTVYAGASLDTADSAVADARTAMLTGLPLLLGLVAGVTWLVTRRALRPVEAIRTELAEIMHGDLSRRVPEPGSRDEIARLAVTTNETLAALEESAQRQRRFIADAAHELRSPIASLRTQLEVAQAHPGLLEPGGLLEDT
ncbi:HAMP domain-containing protein, partial [Nocardia sp. NPDC003345]